MKKCFDAGKFIWLLIAAMLIALFWCGVAIADTDYSDLNAGDTITFGHYEQDNDTTNGKEEIEWYVLDKDSEKVTMISRYILDCKPYNTDNVDVTWETCSLRAWMNSDFVASAFTTQESSKLVTVSVKAQRHPNYNTDPGSDTLDKVYLLSYSEVQQFRSLFPVRTTPTRYTISLGAYTDNGYGQWWLRTPSSSNRHTTFISTYGEFWDNPDHCYVSAKAGVRPVIAVSLSEADEPVSGFDLTRDGWAIPNSKKGFGYGDSYMIPIQRYYQMYLPIQATFMAANEGFGLLAGAEKWGGNCYGLATSAVLNYDNKIDLKAYFSDTVGKSLSEYGYDWKYIGVYALEYTNEVVSLIEKLQLGQKSADFILSEKFITNNYSRKFTQLIQYLTPNSNPLVITLNPGTGGHALVTNTSREPEPTIYIDQDGIAHDGFWAISVYDPNYPYNAGSLDPAEERYTYAKDQWLYINPTTGEWHYLFNRLEGKKVWWGEKGHDTREDAKIKFYDPSTYIDYSLRYGFSIKPKGSSALAYISAEKATIVCSGDSFECNKTDGVDSTLSFHPYCAYTLDNTESTEVMGTIVFPASEEKIQVYDQSNMTTVFATEDHYISVHTNDESTYEVGVADNSITMVSSNNATFDIILVYDNDEDYSSVRLTGTASEGTTTITLNDDNTLSAESTSENFSAEVTFSGSQLDEDITYHCDDINELNDVSMENGKIVRTGSCGDNLVWKLHLNSGALQISGTGTMYDYNTKTNLPPWGTNAKSVEIKNGVTSIGILAFNNSSRMTSITLPSSITNIGSGAFTNCSSLTSITIPNNVTSITNSMFSGCSSLSNISLPNKVTSIGLSAFYKCTSLTSINIPASVTSIGQSAFRYCSGLTSITIPGSVIDIGKCAFQDCSGLTDVAISNGVIGISDQMFQACSDLLSITIPDSVTSIGIDAFRDCTSLNAILIPAGVTSIGFGLSTCSSLQRIDVSIENPSLSSVDGIVFNKDKSQLLLYPAGRIGPYTIPESVTTIGIYNPYLESYGFGFGSCTGLTEIIIPDSVMYIGSSTFNGCTSLTSVTLPNSVVGIGSYAFSHCSSLTGITIPDSVTTIGFGAFSDCSSLNRATISSGMTTILNGFFARCSSLSEITIPASITSIGYDAFLDCNALKTINYSGTWLMKMAISIPYSYGNDPLTTAQWVFLNGDGILTLPAGLHQIDSKALIGLPKFDVVRLPETVTCIADDALDNDIVVVAPAGSYAASWALEHGFEVIEE